MSAESEVQLQKEPVRGRNTSAIKMFAGLSFGEILVVFGVGVLGQILFRNAKVTFGLMILAFAYFRYLKATIPEGYIKNAWRYYTRKHEVYRAGGRDYEWRPPITRD